MKPGKSGIMIISMTSAMLLRALVNRLVECLPLVLQVELWKKFISWEKSNPLRTEDHAVVTKRVMFAYEQCLLCLGYHPDLW